MPDWFYRTVAQRILFALPDKAARGVGLGVIGMLGKSAAGRSIIEFMGHMTPGDQLAVSIGGTRFASPIGLGWRVDPEQRASAGLSCFGIGCLEVRTGEMCDVKREAGETLADVPIKRTIEPKPEARVPLLLRHHTLGGEWLRLPGGTDLRVLAWDHADRGGEGAGGVVLQVGAKREAGSWTVPAMMPEGLLDSVRAWRRALGARAPIIVSGGIGRPGDAVTLIDAGADLLLIDAGLIFRGPGLVNRCNEALLNRRERNDDVRETIPLFRRAWFWTVALGAAMAAGGLATLALALTRVLLPYDEHFLGMTSATLERSLPRLFAFMAHDRATLAGVMLGLGWMYGCLGWCGVRTAQHGAKSAVIASALAGFVSFFAFFGFGYFDTLHAFVAAILFQFTVQIMTGRDGSVSRSVIGGEDDDRDWRLAQWGQLLWVIHAAGLLFAGLLILVIGMTSVFVSEDLGFLCMTAEQASGLGERMMGVIAHDRATLGGMLLASGVAMLLPVLWCFRRGQTWLWRAMAGLGLPAYGAALGIHVKVGYTDWRHMVPALVGAGLWLGGLILTRGHLTKDEPKRKASARHVENSDV